MSIRLAIHVGPHKTGSTSIQRALVAYREPLIKAGVFYPPSVVNAEFPDQHADVAGMLGKVGVGPAFEWVMDACRKAVQRGCDPVILSSENFRAPLIRHRLKSLLRRYRQETKGETRLIYVRREHASLARSRVLARLDGELGFFFRERYDLRTWAADFLHQQSAEERFFRRQAARFLQLEATPPAGLAAEILRLATDRDFSFVVTGRDNVTADRLEGPPATMLAYGVRVMNKVIRGHAIVGNRAAEGVSIAPQVEAAAGYRDLLASFEDTLAMCIAAGFADARREGRLGYRWRLIRRHLQEISRLW